jgi:ribonuclease D
MKPKNAPHRLPAPILVTKTSKLERLLAQLLNEPVIAVDTESNSLYAYQEQVCLIQFSIPGADFLVDPLAELDVSLLGVVFADPTIEKIFHAAEYDVMCLRRDYNWDFANLFDTMWAARILGWRRVGLSSILKERFGVHLNKRWQRHNWGKRPLSAEALAYARLDTHYLLSLRERMLAELKEKNRLEEAREVFAEVAEAEPNFKPFDPDDSLWRVKGVWDLDPDTRAVLRQLLIWRDSEARRRDRPPFKVLHDRTLIELAEKRPAGLDDLQDIKGLKRFHLRHYGPKILEAIAQGKSSPPPEPPPRHTRPEDEVLERYEALRRWRKKTARRRQVDPDVIVSNATLWTLAQRAPQSQRQLESLDLLGPWKQETYGEALVTVVREHS